jgi:type I restriction enzyme S subunit
MVSHRHPAGIAIGFPSESLSASPRNPYRLRPGIAIGIERNMHLNSHLLLFRPLDGLFVNRFLFYVLGTPIFNTYMTRERTGTTFFGISQESIGSFRLALPPVTEQTRILDFLEVEVRKIDTLISKQERLIELLQEKRQALISHAVTKGLNPDAPMKPSGVEWLGEVPEHWQVKRLKHLMNRGNSGIQMGPFGSMLTALSDQPTGYRLYGQENTISGDFTLCNRWINHDQYTQLAKYVLRPGDVVLTRKGSIGKARIVPTDIQPGIMDSDTIRVRLAGSEIDCSFLVRLLHEAWYLAVQIEATSRGAILAGLNTSTIAELSIAVPPLAEQKAITAFLDTASALFDSTAEKTNAAISLMREHRTALISAAVTGKIDVRETHQSAHA